MVFYLVVRQREIITTLLLHSGHYTNLKHFIFTGEVLIAMDTTGNGHQWQMLGDDTWKRLCAV